MGKNYLANVEFIPSPNHSSRGGVEPRMIVLHYTADTGRMAVRYFKTKKARASAHFVVHRDGEVIRMVNIDRSAWHAGFNAKTSYLRERLGSIKPNRSSVGIEIVNAGELNQIAKPSIPATQFYCTTWFGEVIPNDEVMIYDGQPWQTYTREQIISVAQLVTSLCAELNIPRRFMFDGQPGIDYGGYHYDKVPYYLPAGVRLGASRFKDNAGICGHCHMSESKDDPGPAVGLWEGVLGVK